MRLLRRVCFAIFKRTLTGLIFRNRKSRITGRRKYFPEFSDFNHPVTQSCFIFIFMFYLMRVRFPLGLLKIFQITVLPNARSVRLNGQFTPEGKININKRYVS